MNRQRLDHVSRHIDCISLFPPGAPGVIGRGRQSRSADFLLQYGEVRNIHTPVEIRLCQKAFDQT